MPGHFTLGVFSNVAVCGWRGAITPAAVVRIGEIAFSLKERAGPVRHSYVHMMTERVQLPDANTRHEIAKLMPELVDLVTMIVVVLDGSGFWSSALRSFITGVRVLAPRNFDIRAESSIENVLSWFPSEHLKRSGVTVTREQLEYLMREAKAWQNQ